MNDVSIKKALLMLDFQNVALAMLGGSDAVVKRAARLLRWARDAKLPIVHVMLGFNAGYPELDGRNTSLAPLAKAGLMQLGDPRTAIHADLAPHVGEELIVKHRIDAFVGTGLAKTLRGQGIQDLIVAGVATSGAVLSTVRHAGDLDFGITLVEDCCKDFDAGTHRLIVGDVLGRQARIVSVETLVGESVAS